MAIIMNIKIRRLMKRLKAFETEAIKAVRKGMSQGMIRFKGAFIKEQLSGRISANFGLNRQTGSLARGFKTRTSGTLKNTKVALFTDLIYARIHQFGGWIVAKSAPFLLFKIGENWVRKERVFIPKRLNFIEKFEAEGNTFLLSSVVTRLRKVAL